MSPKYKITYFDIRGYAEISRLILVYKGIEFEDERIAFDDWPRHKHNAPNGQLPYLTLEDGTEIPQSAAMARFLAREHGLIGKTNLEVAQVDVVVDNFSDLMDEVMRLIYPQTVAEKEATIKKCREVLIPAAMKNFTKILEENGTSYFVGKSLTLADLVIFGGVYQLRKFFVAEIVDDYPAITSHYDRIMELPNIKEYVARRKDTAI
ncbi:GstS1 (predicted) [Pycnogonum litorale]